MITLILNIRHSGGEMDIIELDTGDTSDISMLELYDKFELYSGLINILDDKGVLDFKKINDISLELYEETETEGETDILEETVWSS